MTESTAPHRTPSGEVEAAVLGAAARLLTDEGPGALSLRRIAAEAGVAPMSVYNRFGNKHGVVLALFEAGFTRLAADLASIDGSDPFESLREAGRRYRRFALAHPAEFVVMFEQPIREFVPGPEDKHCAAGAFDALVVLVRRAMAAGVIAGVEAGAEPVTVAQLLWATVHGAVSLELKGIGFVDDRDAFYEVLLATVTDGLRPYGRP